jgi:Uma2 family endonuclease
MASAVETKLLTAEEFMAADLGEGTYELVRGEVIQMPPPRPRHGRVSMNVAFILEAFGRRTGLGYVLINDAAVLTERNPDTVRGADVTYYSNVRWPSSDVGSKLPPVPPDVAVEVRSPSNRAGEVNKKVSEYLAVGTALVWVVDPSSNTVNIFRAGNQPPITLNEGDVIENLPELPEFRCLVSEFFV